MNNKFFTPTSTRVSSRLNDYLRENFGYTVDGDIKELQKAKVRLERMQESGQNYVETTMMLEAVKALLKARVDEVSADMAKRYKKKAKVDMEVNDEILSRDGKTNDAETNRKLHNRNAKRSKGIANANKRIGEAAKPDFLDIDKDGDKKEPMKKAANDAKKIKESSCGCCGNTPCDCGPNCDCTKKSLEESLLANLNALLENDAASAEITMAARGIVDELQDVIEKLGKIQNDQLGPLVDEMTYTHGGDQAQAFRSSVDTAIGALLEQSRQAKEDVNNAVLILTGEAPATDTMAPSGDEIGGDMTADFEDDVSADDQEADFTSGDEANSGPVDEPLGRARR